MRCTRLAVVIIGLTLATAPFAWAAGSPQATPATPATPAAPAKPATPAVPATQKAPNPQQEKMAACNKDATSHHLKGDERKTFMKDCLSSGSEEAGKKLTAQQTKMKTCNADASAKKLTGAARKTFMSECLKK